jgi:hypothetical protein
MVFFRVGSTELPDENSLGRNWNGKYQCEAFPDQVIAGAISRSMRFAFSISATRKSNAACRFSHERASPPK